MTSRLRSWPVHGAVLSLVLVVLAVMPGGGAVSAGEAGDGPEFVLDDEVTSAFWQGPGDAAPDCGNECWSYRVTVTEPGHRLRVAIDRPTLGDAWTITLQRPDGSLVGSSSPGTELYSAEVHETSPALGTYVTEVTAQSVADRRFRMRAGLDADDLLPTERTLVPPNLRPLPPWDFSFRYPVTNGAVGGDSIGVDTPGGRVACHPEEVVLYEAVRCLRMSYGVANVGLGPLELEVGPGRQFTDRPLIQHVRYSDGSFTTRDAGNAYYHHSHVHYHHDHAIGLELLRVVDEAAGTLEAAAEPQPKGFAHRDELLRDWTSFYPVWAKSGFGLLAGWGDYYEWDRPGNYIDFGLNADALYVVRLTADPDGFILETDSTDNVAYSLIRVIGDQVEHLESGRGTDPWDPCRIPLPLGPEWEDSFEAPAERPGSCAG